MTTIVNHQGITMDLPAKPPAKSAPDVVLASSLPLINGQPIQSLTRFPDGSWGANGRFGYTALERDMDSILESFVGLQSAKHEPWGTVIIPVFNDTGIPESGTHDQDLDNPPF